MSAAITPWEDKMSNLSPYKLTPCQSNSNKIILKRTKKNAKSLQHINNDVQFSNTIGIQNIRKNMPILRGKRQAKECDSKLAQILDIADKHFKAAIINIFEELSKITFNELK